MKQGPHSLGKKIVIFIVLAIAVVAAMLWTRHEKQGGLPGPLREQAVVGIQAGTVERRNLADVRVFSGTLSAEKQYDAAFKVSGRIREIAVHLGDCLERGALIARLDSEEYEQQLAQARAELDVAEAALAEAQSSLVAAERDYQRALKLRDQKVASAAELESAETEQLARQAGVNLAQAQIKQRQAALRAAEVRLSYTTLTADWHNGPETACRFVAGRHVDEGATVAANAPVVTLVDQSLHKAEINVAERDYALLQTDQQARITVDAVPDRSFAGTVVRLAPVFEETSRQARVEIAVDNPDYLLKAGMFARVYIELSRADQAVAAPITAVIRRLGTTGVFVVEEGVARFVEVNPGIEHDGWVQVDGLEVGQQVVTLGHHLLSDGVRVTTGGEADQAPRQVNP
ncbi:MAG: efflux RND transporter periplasmic adaptor subunit [Desulfofustis sp.]|jgi:RND family efflux transporter MFP subunit|nr:efflux RND transporter periplasmic adaptor subunit [Desulfofustis sp.]